MEMLISNDTTVTICYVYEHSVKQPKSMKLEVQGSILVETRYIDSYTTAHQISLPYQKLFPLTCSKTHLSFFSFSNIVPSANEL